MPPRSKLLEYDPETNTKFCTGCSSRQSFDDFGPALRYTDGKAKYCRACLRFYAKNHSFPDSYNAKLKGYHAEGLERCSTCQEVKPFTEFSKNSARDTGYNNQCRPCFRTQLRARRAKNIDGTTEADYQNRIKRFDADPEYKEQYYLKMRLKNYNITEDKYRSLLESQNFSCALCLIPFGDNTPHIDHDHSCCSGGSSCGLCVRALLCSRCNRGLGNFQDDINLLQRAQEYLSSHRPNEIWRE